MNSTEGLKRLQANDLERDRIERALAELGNEIPLQRKAVAKMEQLLIQSGEASKKVAAELRAKEGEVEDMGRQKARAEKKLTQVTSPKMAEAVQKEIQQWAEKISQAEEAVLEVMEAVEEAESTVAQIEDGLGKLRAKVTRIEAELPERRKQLEAELEGIVAEDEKWRGYCKEKDLERYDRLRKRYKGRVVLEVDEACLGCDRMFTEDQRRTLMQNSDIVYPCSSCERLMIFEGAQSL